MKEFLAELYYRIYKKGIRRLIPRYRDRTIFTKFFWRCWWSRRTKGFDESETWGLYYNLSKLIAPRLEMFLKYADISVPGFYVTEVEQELLAKGKPYDYRYHHMQNKKDRKYVFKEAGRRWMADVTKMKNAFYDIMEEDNDYAKWSKKYEKQTTICNRKMAKMKTMAERKAYWDSFGFEREYRANITFMDFDFAQKIRKEGLDLFSKYFQNLWW